MFIKTDEYLVNSNESFIEFNLYLISMGIIYFKKQDVY